jgi:DNA-binding response OmpR family regulator
VVDERRAEVEVHVIVLDLVMPRVSGFEVLNWMRQHHLETSVVLATTEDDVSAADLGAFVKLSKPFTQEELLAAGAAALRATP